MPDCPRVVDGGGAAGYPERAVDVALPADAVVIRFRPTAPDRVYVSAENEQVRCGRLGLSIFADAPREGEDEQAVVERLLAVAELSGMDSGSHPKYYLCADGNEISGYTFYKVEGDEVPEHYNVDLGENATVDDVLPFLEKFKGMKR
jgi:hypothetical protein